MRPLVKSGFKAFSHGTYNKYTLHKYINSTVHNFPKPNFSFIADMCIGRKWFSILGVPGNYIGEREVKQFYDL